jgi:FAD/FMN-containing dehydrogenase
VVGLDLLAADGSLITATDEQEPEVLAAARVGLGALGIISTVTVRCVPPFNLHAVETAVHLDEVLEGLDALIDGNDHLGLSWLPHSDWVQVSRFNRTDRPESGRSPWAQLRESAGRAGRMPRLVRALPGRARSETVERSHRVFTRARPVAVAESEFAIARFACADALRRIRRLSEGGRAEPGLSIAVRFAAADDIALSPAEGRDTCYVAVRAGRRPSYAPYFHDIEAILDPLGGRPHWGTIHEQTAATLAPRYSRWESFAAVRERLDPERRFTNAYLERVLGS